MNADLDPMLSAYLDGELDGPGRRRIEQATRSDPVAADRLAALSRTRDLVATLSTPMPAADVSGSVLAALAGREAARRLAWRRAGVAMAALVPALAAAVVLAMFIVGRMPNPEAPTVEEAPAVVTGPPVLPSPAPARPAPPRVSPARPSPSLLPVAQAIPAPLLAEETKARDDRDKFEAILARPDVRLISITVDTVGPATLDRMDDAIRNSNFREPEHARLRVVQNIVIDPKRPGSGCVYALVMDDFEHDVFLANLEKRFPRAIHEDATPDRNALAALPKVDRVEILRVQPRGTMRPNPPEEVDDIAARHPKNAMAGQTIIDLNPGAVPARGPVAKAGGAADRPAGKAAPRAPARGLPDGDPPSAVYIVWLTERQRS